MLTVHADPLELDEKRVNKPDIIAGGILAETCKTCLGSWTGEELRQLPQLYSS